MQTPTFLFCHVQRLVGAMAIVVAFVACSSSSSGLRVADAGAGGKPGTGGIPGSGGNALLGGAGGGALANGGMQTAGGISGAGGVASGGASASGGAVGSGGAGIDGGPDAAGGSPSTGGKPGTGGILSSGGVVGAGGTSKGGSGGGAGGISGSGGGGGCPPIASCNWCSGTYLKDGNGCVIGFRCANGADPCKTAPCTTLSPCQTGFTCQDMLCWPNGSIDGGQTDTGGESCDGTVCGADQYCCRSFMGSSCIRKDMFCLN